SEIEVDHVRLFRNHPQLRWKYRVHEQILPGLRQIGSDMRWADVAIYHAGYQDPALRARKRERDLRLLDMENAEQPDDPFTLFNLGSVYLDLERPADALPPLQRSLERSATGDSIVRKLYALIAVCRRRLHQTKEALAVCLEGRWHYPDDVELLFQEAMARRDLGDLAGAEAAYQRCLQDRPGKHFASVDTGVSGQNARHNPAIMYREQGRLAEAEAQWRAAVVEQPGFGPSWSALAELCHAQGRWPELEQVAGHLENGAAC